MSKHPANLFLRFVFELAALYAMGLWGWTSFSGPARWLAAVGLPLLAAAAWGVFRVPNDGGRPVVQVSGPARLALEAVFFGAAVLGLWFAGRESTAVIFLVVVLAHYAASFDRVLALAKNQPL